MESLDNASKFTMQGRRNVRKHMQIGARKSSEMRNKLEDMIMGNNSNRQEFLHRNSNR